MLMRDVEVVKTMLLTAKDVHPTKRMFFFFLRVSWEWFWFSKADLHILGEFEWTICQEFIGKHFPDVPGEEDCTKARPVKAR